MRGCAPFGDRPDPLLEPVANGVTTRMAVLAEAMVAE